MGLSKKWGVVESRLCVVRLQVDLMLTKNAIFVFDHENRNFFILGFKSRFFFFLVGNLTLIPMVAIILFCHVWFWRYGRFPEGTFLQKNRDFRPKLHFLVIN